MATKRRSGRPHFIVSTHVPTWLRDRLVPGEFVVMSTRLHIASLIEPVLQTVGIFLIALALDVKTGPDLARLVGVGWFVFVCALGRLAWILLGWWHRWFVATNKRLWLRQGLLNVEIATLPLAKVTDMRYERGVWSNLPFLDYGRFVMESAGQEQALRQVDWVPHPDSTHLTISNEMFAENNDPEDGTGSGSPGGGDGGDGGGWGRGRMRLPKVRWKVGRWTPGRGGSGSGYGPISAGAKGRATKKAKADAAAVGAVPRKRRETVSDAKKREGEGRASDPYPDVASTNAHGNPVQDRINSYSRAIPVQPGESVYRSPDPQDAGDTGPVSIYPDPTRPE